MIVVGDLVSYGQTAGSTTIIMYWCLCMELWLPSLSGQARMSIDDMKSLLFGLMVWDEQAGYLCLVCISHLH